MLCMHGVCPIIILLYTVTAAALHVALTVSVFVFFVADVHIVFVNVVSTWWIHAVLDVHI